MKLVLPLIIVLLSGSCTAQRKIDPAALLAQAELKRMPWKEMSMKATLEDSSGATPVRAVYHVYLDGDQALVACLQPETQQGNLLLLQKEDLWYFLRTTSRPVKITPLQKLAGAVSFVDVTRLNWSGEFRVDTVETVREGNTGEYLLRCTAVSPQVTYRKINLWIDQRTGRPLKEEVYLTSGKLYKTVLFTRYENVHGRDMNVRVEFVDHFNHDRRSVLTFSEVQPVNDLPADYFDRDKLPVISKTIR